jgi:hypothetical protein
MLLSTIIFSVFFADPTEIAICRRATGRSTLFYQRHNRFVLTVILSSPG